MWFGFKLFRKFADLVCFTVCEPSDGKKVGLAIKIVVSEMGFVILGTILRVEEICQVVCM